MSLREKISAEPQPWILFPNCDTHFTNDPDWFHDESFCSFKSIAIKCRSRAAGGNLEYDVLGVGNITLPVSKEITDLDNGALKLKHVLYVPGLEYNIIGITALSRDGIQFGDVDGRPSLIRKNDEQPSKKETISMLDIHYLSGLTMVRLQGHNGQWEFDPALSLYAPVWQYCERTKWKRFLETQASLKKELEKFQQQRLAVERMLTESTGMNFEEEASYQFTRQEIQLIHKNRRRIKGILATLADPMYFPLEPEITGREASEPTQSQEG